ncbi:MAG: ANTAR domain-containing protein, partial [Sulfuritalea sp.]|nr:ANTAR domain-containing protein [Sulfuritalea sp.]
TAVGMLMRSEGLDQAPAFEHLRQQARKQRRKVEDIARAIIDAGKEPP